ncbi:MAG: hypothetical protein HFG64_00525 [Lachnospiraceae bacterium]|nr:hypothetical protein [Lachnospiraceae bacterium]
MVTVQVHFEWLLMHPPPALSFNSGSTRIYTLAVFAAMNRTFLEKGARFCAVNLIMESRFFFPYNSL